MFKFSFLNYVLPGIVGGIIGATLNDLLSEPRALEVKATSFGDLGNPDMDSLRREVAALRVEQQALNAALSSLRHIDVQREPVDGFVSKKEFDELAQNLKTNDGSPPVALQDQIKATLKEVRETEDAEKVIASRKNQVSAVAGWLSLTDGQQELYLETLFERDVASQDFRERWEAGTITSEEAGAIKRENQTRHFDRVASILNGQQLETFNRYRAERENWGK